MPTPRWSFLPSGEYSPQTALPQAIHIVSSDRPIENPMRPWLDQNKANKAKLRRVGNDAVHGSALAMSDQAWPYPRLCLWLSCGSFVLVKGGLYYERGTHFSQPNALNTPLSQSRQYRIILCNSDVVRTIPVCHRRLTSH